MTRRISWISWTQYHKVSFNFNSQHPHPPHQQLFISIQLPYISNGCDSRTGLFSKLPHKCEHYMNKCVHRSLEKMLFSRSSRFGRVSYCLQSRQHLPLSTLQSKSRAVHFRAVCQVVTASGSISWLRISTHTSSSTNVPPAYVDRLRWGKCSLWQNRSESPPNGPLMHHCTHKKEVGNSTWPLPQVK